MPRVSLPPGCYGLKVRGMGKTPNVRPGSSVTVTDEQARAIKKSPNGQLGIVSAGQSLAIATKKGRWCGACRFLAQSWSVACPRCGGATTEEE